MRQAIVLHLAALPALLSGIACTPVHPQVHADFLDGLRHGATVTVFPALVRHGTRHSYDRGASERIADHLRRAGVHALAADSKDLSRYALAPEFAMDSQGDVRGVRVTVIRADGELAALVAINPGDSMFQSLKPTNRDECTALVIAAINEKWMTP
jgi:hypothetical protein